MISFVGDFQARHAQRARRSCHRYSFSFLFNKYTSPQITLDTASFALSNDTASFVVQMISYHLTSKGYNITRNTSDTISLAKMLKITKLTTDIISLVLPMIQYHLYLLLMRYYLYYWWYYITCICTWCGIIHTTDDTISLVFAPDVVSFALFSRKMIPYQVKIQVILYHL